MKVETKTLILLSIDIHVVVIIVILISVKTDTLDQKLVYQVRILRHFFDLTFLVRKLKLIEIFTLWFKLLKESAFDNFLKAFIVMIS